MRVDKPHEEYSIRHSRQILVIYTSVLQYLSECLLRNNFYRDISIYGTACSRQIRFYSKYAPSSAYLSEKIWFENRRYLDAPLLLPLLSSGRAKKKREEKGGMCELSAYARKFAGVHARHGRDAIYKIYT